MQFLSKLDVYRKVPRDISEATTSGALVSCITLFLAIWLFYNELDGYLTIRRESEMLIDDHISDEKLQMNLAVTFPRLPCELLSVDAQDQLGSHDVDVFGNLFKDRLDANGTFVERQEIDVGRFGAASGLYRHYSFNYQPGDKDKIDKMIEDKEGCQVTGFLKLNKVPGNVHISTHSHGHMFGHGLSNDHHKLDISHTVHHLSFGKDSDVMELKDMLHAEGMKEDCPWFKGLHAVNPLDGTTRNVHDEPATKKEEEHEHNRFHFAFANQLIYEYYLKVVPTQFVNYAGRVYDVYQHTVNSHTIRNSAMPSIYFRFDISPVAVKFEEARDSFYHFLVHACAIVGGLVTIAGLVDAMLHSAVVNISRKIELGKMG